MHWLAVIMYLIFLLRLYKTKRLTLIVGSLVLSFLVILVTNVHQWTNQTKLTTEDKNFTVIIKPDEIKNRW